MPLKILITDDHGVLRAGLEALLAAENDLQVVGEAENADQAIEMAAALRPDIILMDLSLPGMGGIEATRTLKKMLPEVKVMILTLHEDRSMLLEALQAGASGYMLKRAVKNELLASIRAIASGGIYVHPAMAHALLPAPPSEVKIAEAPGEEALTQREIDVLRLIAQGYTNSQAAAFLSVSVRTIEYHRSNLVAKLRISSRVDLIRYAQEHNLL